MGIFARKRGGAEPSSDRPARPEDRLVVNRRVQRALAAWAVRKDAQTISGVLRECVTGDLLLDASDSTTRDPARPFQEGDQLAVGFQVDNAGKRLLVAFTDNERLAEYRRRGGSPTPPRSLVQPAAATLQMAATAPYEGIAIDPGSSDTLCIAYADEIRNGLTEDPAVNEPLKTAIAVGAPEDELVALAAAAPVVFIGAQVHRDERGEVTGVGVPTIRSPEGETYSPVFTSPAEVWAWAPDLDARPTGFANVARVAQEDGHAGVVLNPAGDPAPLRLQAFADRFPLS
ncbi:MULTISPECIES: SseB family protein [unclassified Curtobacterium]|uniref:SseB family protein n=1 Tax=unclassified Curtobacterium TaxID=257496 RepID=UPI000DA71B86|nr:MULTISPECIES: SseB family protein [unclassified Curtobacterium]WIB63097.1 SseB family protein [Curtobacterium sp. MCBD17_040]WIB66948.1 SseB family protein [Curtobacterium sp. MCBD17_035]